MNPVSQPFGACPCRSSLCDEQGTKLSGKTGHLVSCRCAPCIGAASVKTGRRAQQLAHENLGGVGRAPTNEERAKPYPLLVWVMPESKGGEQPPASFEAFMGSAWMRRAMSQSERAAPIGSAVVPSVVIHGRYLFADLSDRARRIRG